MTETTMTPPLAATTLRRDQEDVRLVTGFADIFAAVVLVGGLIALVGLAVSFIGPAGGLAGVVAVWFLPVPLVERRQFAACALVLAMAFAATLALPAFALLDIFGALPVAAAMYFYWQRYKIPLSAAIGLAALVAFPALVILRFVAGSNSAIDDIDSLIGLPGWISLGVGLTLFVLAMRWDLSDRERVTRRSDVAFWLHVMAGPLAVHGLFSLIGIGRFETGEFNPWPVVALFALFTVTALTIDRRPLLLSSFGYFLFALGQIIYGQMAPTDAMTRNAVSIPQAIMIAAFSGGLVVAILAAGWSALRRALLSIMPAQIRDRVPPVSVWTPPATYTRADAPGESEPVRLVLGLNDYLATLGLGVLFVGGLVAAYVVMSGAMASITQSGGVFAGDAAAKEFLSLWSGATPWLALAAPLAVVLIAAEVFVRRQRMALTAVVTAFQFAILSILGAMLVLWQWQGASRVGEQMTVGGAAEAPVAASAIILVCLGAAAANLAFGWINRIPVTAAFAALMAVPLLFLDQIVAMSAKFGQTDAAALDVEFRLLGFGLAAFVIAFILDRTDPERKSQRADVAFWLHLLASLFAVVVLFRGADTTASPTAATLGLYALLVVLALFINRRAPLIVGIPFVVSAIEVSDGSLQFLTQLAFFGALMALVLMWDRLRGQALAAFGQAR